MTDAYEDAVYRFDRLRAKHRERMAAANEGLRGIAVSATSADGSARVSVNAEGMLTGLHIGQQAVSMSPAELSAAVLDAYASAQREAARRAADLLRSVTGSDVVVEERIRWRQEFTPAVLREESPPTPAPHRHDDDDFNPGALYRA